MSRNRIRRLTGLSAMLAALAMSHAAAQELEFAIQSFDQNGRLTFAELPSNAGAYARYRVEWAPSAGGPWTNFAAAQGTLDWIRATGSNSITCMVPMFYRVIATVMDLNGMVIIPAGTNAGTDPDGDAYSHTIPCEFMMDKYEVTKALWDEVRDWSLTDGYSYDNAGSGKATNHPVHTISWYDAVKWCNARSEKEGLEPVYYIDAALTQIYKTGSPVEPYLKSTVGYRLPTWDEWQYAARGGKVGHRFAWDDAETISHARANYKATTNTWDLSAGAGYHPTYNDGAQPYSSPVGSFAPNAWGLYDMDGNMQECLMSALIAVGMFSGHDGAGCWWGADPYGLARYRMMFAAGNGFSFRCIRYMRVD